MFAIVLGILIILASFALIIHTWVMHNRYAKIRKQVIIYEAVVTDFAIEPVSPFSFLVRRYQQRRCDITLYIPETDEDLEVSTILTAARNLKNGKRIKVHYFPDEIYDPRYFTRQKVLPFEIYARTVFSAAGLTIVFLMLTLIGVIMILSGLE